MSLFEALRNHLPNEYSMEYADVRLSLLSAQRCKCAICGDEFISSDSISCHLKVPSSNGGREQYNNMVLLHKKYLPLLTEQNIETLRMLCDLLHMTKKQLTKINNLRAAANLAAI